ncbi:cobalt ECF transporter T component CbiQ [Kineothrix sp. MB12-C1]|uniref:cobalt ECF transporter T component CbiQ n=1 Tax=Kineothrix sp. MB12-C1 TaxID=3070215 RepID=UPI0027D23AFE|nr:cobalt ECF transporter T component CbiQ [Kineothrix sp. MB12-C1]WMC93298.1 cobalt ECF transporter T component CbiQ [Kineothrix sp. MB12-C1]
MQRKKKGNKKRNKSIDQYAYRSGLREWNTAYKAIFAIFPLFTVIAADSILLSLITVLYMGSLSIVIGKIGIGNYLRLLLVPTAFILTGAIAVLVQIGEGADSLFLLHLPIGNIYVTKESIWQTGHLICKAFAGVSALYMLALSTPMGEIISVFRRARIPSILLELMHLIYRYIFLLFEINVRQNEAAKSRLGYCDYRTSLRTFGSEMANLLILSMKKSGEYYDALESRGYEGNCLFWEERRKFTVTQALWGAAYVGVALLVICG